MLQPAGKRIYTAVWGEGKKVCTAPRKANCTEAKEYHLFSILSFIQIKMEEFVARNIGDESLWYVCYICNNLPTHQWSPQNNTPRGYTYTVYSRISKCYEDKSKYN
jgi:hypothetical protein